MQKAIDWCVQAYYPSESAVNIRNVFAGNGFNASPSGRAV
jgi:type III secretory pathway lipoprotein EscJ